MGVWKQEVFTHLGRQTTGLCCTWSANTLCNKWCRIARNTVPIARSRPIWVRSRKMRGRSRKSYSLGGASLGNQYLATSRCTYKHNFCIARPSFNNLDPLLPPPEKWHINGYTLKYSTEQTVRSLVITTAQEYNFSLAPTNITLSDLLSQNSNLL